MTIDALPPAANPDDAEQDFDLAAYAWASALPLWTNQVNAMADDVSAKQTAAAASAELANLKADAATSAAITAAAAANFKGLWETLVGALVRPACVKYAGRFWALLSDLDDVTAATPGGHAAWTVMDVGTVPTQVVTVNTAALVGVRYLIAANGITLTAPVGAVKGDYFGFREVAGLTGAVVDFGAVNVRGRAPGAMTINAPRVGEDLYFEDAARGYC